MGNRICRLMEYSKIILDICSFLGHVYSRRDFKKKSLVGGSYARWLAVRYFHI